MAAQPFLARLGLHSGAIVRAFSLSALPVDLEYAAGIDGVNIGANNVWSNYASGVGGCIIGRDNTITTAATGQTRGLYVGRGLTVNGAQANCIVMGIGTTVGGSTLANAICIVNGGTVTNVQDSVIIGSPDSSNTNCVLVGQQASSTATGGTALGRQSLVEGDHGIAVGRSANAAILRSVAIGGGTAAQFAKASASNAIAIGAGATTGARASGIGSIALGGSASTGDGALASGEQSIAFGAGSITAHAHGIALGGGAATTKANQIVLGNATNHTEVRIPSTTASNNSTSGALVIAGGAGLEGDVRSAGQNSNFGTSTIVIIEFTQNVINGYESPSACSLRSLTAGYPNRAAGIFGRCVHSTSNNGVGYGVFGYAENVASKSGIAVGVRGHAVSLSTTSGQGEACGVNATAVSFRQDPASIMYGVRAVAESKAVATAGIVYGGHFTATGATTSPNAYGIYATASGAVTNYSAYFGPGRVHISDSTVTVSPTSGALTVAGGVGIVGDLNIGGKLTVAGLIDPTGLALTPVAANPGGSLNASTLWVNTGDGNKLYFGASAVGGSGTLPTGTTEGSVLTWDATGSEWLENTGVVFAAGVLTVTGLVGATGAQLSLEAANPGDDYTLWANSADGNKLYFGDAAVGGSPVPSGTTEGSLLTWDATGSEWVENTGVVFAAGVLTVTGLASATGLQMSLEAANPGDDYTLWVNSGDGNKLYFGASAVGGSGTLPTGTTEGSILTWDDTGSEWLENTSVVWDTTKLIIVGNVQADEHIIGSFASFSTTVSAPSTTYALYVDQVTEELTFDGQSLTVWRNVGSATILDGDTADIDTVEALAAEWHIAIVDTSASVIAVTVTAAATSTSTCSYTLVGPTDTIPHTIVVTRANGSFTLTVTANGADININGRKMTIAS